MTNSRAECKCFCGIPKDGTAVISNIKSFTPWRKSQLLTNYCLDYLQGTRKLGCIIKWLGTTPATLTTLPKLYTCVQLLEQSALSCNIKLGRYEMCEGVRVLRWRLGNHEGNSDVRQLLLISSALLLTPFGPSMRLLGYLY
jgi:hypothetical protein